MYFKKYLKRLFTARYYFLIISLFCGLLVTASYFVENVLTIEPCVLCSMQRIIFSWILGASIVGLLSEIIFLDLLLKNIFTNITHNIFLWLCLINNFFCSIIGGLIAGRQSWLQHAAHYVHDSVHSCAGGLEHLFEKYPLAMAISQSFKPNLSCSQVHVKFLGLSLANWSFLSFTIILLFSSTIIYKKFTRKL